MSSIKQVINEAVEKGKEVYDKGELGLTLKIYLILRQIPLNSESLIG